VCKKSSSDGLPWTQGVKKEKKEIGCFLKFSTAHGWLRRTDDPHHKTPNFSSIHKSTLFSGGFCQKYIWSSSKLNGGLPSRDFFPICLLFLSPRAVIQKVGDIVFPTYGPAAGFLISRSCG
jgi:hypothetical protein